MKLTKILTNIFGSTKREVTAIPAKAKEEIQHIYFSDAPLVKALKGLSNSSKCQNTEACRVLVNMSSNPVDLDFARESIVKAVKTISENHNCPGRITALSSKLFRSKLDSVAISSNKIGLTFPMHKGCRIGVSLKNNGKIVMILPDKTEIIFDDITVKLSGKPYTGVVKYFDKTLMPFPKDSLPVPCYYIFDKGKLVNVFGTYSNGSCNPMF